MRRMFVVAIAITLGLSPVVHAQYPSAPTPNGPLPGYTLHPEMVQPMQAYPANDLGATGGPARGGIFAGVGMYLFQPRFQSNPAFQISTFNPGAPVVGSQREFN